MTDHEERARLFAEVRRLRDLCDLRTTEAHAAQAELAHVLKLPMPALRWLRIRGRLLLEQRDHARQAASEWRARTLVLETAVRAVSALDMEEPMQPDWEARMQVAWQAMARLAP